MIGFEARGTILDSYAIGGVNRRRNYIECIRVRVERVICKLKCAFVL